MEELIKGEDNPNAVLRIAANESPVIGELAPEEWQLLDGLVEQSGILAALFVYNQQMRGEEELRLDHLPPTEASKKKAGLVRMSSIGGASRLCQGPFYRPDAARLSEMMDLQIKGEIYSTDTGLLDASELLFGVSGVLATAGVGPKTAKVAGAMGSIITGLKIQWSAYEGILPSQWIDLTIQVMPDYFLEDSENLEGNWEKAMLTAQSKGWNADKEVFNFLLSKLGGQLTKNAAGKAKINVGDNLEAIMEVEYVESVVNLMWDVLGNSITNELYGPEPGKGGIFEFPPCTFGPTDISGEEWSEARIIHENKAPVFMLDHHTYQARATGEAILEVKPHGKKFGRRYLGPDGTFLTADEIITVLPIEVEVSPSEYIVEPGEVVVFKAVVYNAYDRDVVWEVSPAGAHEVHVSTEADGSSVITVYTSKDEGDFPVTVTATSTASKGLRALPDAPPRQGHGLIRSNKLSMEITPKSCCIEPGEQETFTAIVHNTDNQEVTWSASAGKISPAGVYTAPSTAGNVTIKATSVADPSVHAEVQVQVGGCDCRAEWEISVFNEWQSSNVSQLERAGDNGEGRLTKMLFSHIDYGDNLQITFDNGGPLPGEKGTYEVSIVSVANEEKAKSIFFKSGSALGLASPHVPNAFYILPPPGMNPEDLNEFHDVLKATVTIDEFIELGPESHQVRISGTLQGEVAATEYDERLPLEANLSSLHYISNISGSFRGDYVVRHKNPTVNPIANLGMSLSFVGAGSVYWDVCGLEEYEIPFADGFNLDDLLDMDDMLGEMDPEERKEFEDFMNSQRGR